MVIAIRVVSILNVMLLQVFIMEIRTLTCGFCNVRAFLVVKSYFH